jgi:hypothetical protein
MRGLATAGRETPKSRPRNAAPRRLLADRCRGFQDEVIDSRAIFEMLRYAARWGEPHALARLLLFRDIAAPKDDALGDLPWLLTSREPSIVRDVGAFLSRGEAEWRYGDEQRADGGRGDCVGARGVRPGQVVRSQGRFALAQCASLGRCSDWRYEEAVALYEPPELMAAAQRLRSRHPAGPAQPRLGVAGAIGADPGSRPGFQCVSSGGIKPSGSREGLDALFPQFFGLVERGAAADVARFLFL